MKGSELAKNALEMIGAWVPADGDPNAADVERALVHANLMLDSWNAQDLARYATERQSFPWTAGQSSRTIGAAGDLVGTYPLAVLWAKVIPAGASHEIPVNVMTHRQYAGISNKAQTAAYFTDLLFERTAEALGTLKVWPVPTDAPTLILHNKVELTEIEAETDIEITREGKPALVSSLAKRLAPNFGKPWTKELEDIRREDWAAFQRANLRVPDETCMPAGFPGSGRGGVSDSQYDSGQF